MPKSVRRKNQSKSEKRAIKKLRDLGIIKADLRKAPTPATKRALKKYADVVSGKAVVVKPKNPKSFRKLFRVAGKNVIVPKRKGERISVNKSGELVRKRRVGKMTTRGTFKHVPKPEKAPRRKRKGKGGWRTVYALPVARAGFEVEWYRFKTWGELVSFIQSGSLRGYTNFADYVVEEELRPGQATHPDPESDDGQERAEQLDYRLEVKLRHMRERRAMQSAFGGSSSYKGYEG